MNEWICMESTGSGDDWALVWLSTGSHELDFFDSKEDFLRFKRLCCVDSYESYVYVFSIALHLMNSHCMPSTDPMDPKVQSIHCWEFIPRIIHRISAIFLILFALIHETLRETPRKLKYISLSDYTNRCLFWI